MNWRLPICLFFAGLALMLGAAAAPAQTAPNGHASDFTSIEYFDPPFEQQMKTRLSGADALPLADNNGSVSIKNMKLETFITNGAPQLVVEAPDCVYDTINGIASSPGPLRMQSGDSRLNVSGDGFLWRRADSFLTISNHVKTVIQAGTFKLSPP